MVALQTRDGLALHVAAWPGGDTPRATVLIVHGLGEHAGRYAHVAAALNARGYDVVAYDQRGHGRSGGRRGALAAPDDLLRDLAVVVDAARARRPGPLVLLGHSMGGTVAARFVAEEQAARPAAWHRPLDALVLTSPALDPGMSAAQRLLLAVLGPLAPWLPVGNGVVPAHVSRDPAVVAAYVGDALVHDRVTPRLVCWLVDAGAHVVARAAGWRTPTLLLYAGADRCVSPEGSAAFAARAPAAFVTTHAYPALFHEILNEPERGAVLDTIADWLDART